jgi:hypothetical protein
MLDFVKTGLEIPGQSRPIAIGTAASVAICVAETAAIRMTISPTLVAIHMAISISAGLYSLLAAREDDAGDNSAHGERYKYL